MVIVTITLVIVSICITLLYPSAGWRGEHQASRPSIDKVVDTEKCQDKKCKYYLILGSMQN